MLYKEMLFIKETNGNLFHLLIIYYVKDLSKNFYLKLLNSYWSLSVGFDYHDVFVSLYDPPNGA